MATTIVVVYRIITKQQLVHINVRNFLFIIIASIQDIYWGMNYPALVGGIHSLETAVLTIRLTFQHWYH
jgi:hypothetical protein